MIGKLTPGAYFFSFRQVCGLLLRGSSHSFLRLQLVFKAAFVVLVFLLFVIHYKVKKSKAIPLHA